MMISRLQSDQARHPFRGANAICIGLASACAAVMAGPESSSLPPLPLSAVSANQVEGAPKSQRTHVQWKGQDHPLTEGIDLLIDTLQAKDAAGSDRVEAIAELARIPWDKKRSEVVTALLTAYPSAPDNVSRYMILRTLSQSRTPQALPLFAKLVQNGSVPSERFCAAAGLAAWNVRSGVRGLIDLIPSTAKLPDNREIGEEALKLIQNMSVARNWGFSVRDVAAEVAADPANADSAQARSAWTKKAADWMKENEERFPEWKIGAPIPSEPQADSH